MQEEASRFAAFVGIDWADASTTSVSRYPAQMATSSRSSSTARRPSRSGPTSCASASTAHRIAVCIELSQGPIVSALLEHDIFVIFPINPSTLRQVPPGVHAQSRQGRPHRRRDCSWTSFVATATSSSHSAMSSPEMRVLRRLVEARRALVQDRVRLTNRLTFALKAYFPQVLEVVS